MIEPCIHGKADPVPAEFGDHICPIAAVFAGGECGATESVISLSEIRTKAKNLAKDDSNYAEVAASCHAFDTGMEDAEEEVDDALEDSDYQPIKLKEFLLLGER